MLPADSRVDHQASSLTSAAVTATTDDRRPPSSSAVAMLRSLSRSMPRTRRSSTYDLPLTGRERQGPRQWWARFHTKRILRVVVFAFAGLFAIRLFFGLDAFVAVVKSAADDGKPPLYEKYHEWELKLPQHNPDLPPPEGRHGQYIWMANHVHGAFIYALSSCAVSDAGGQLPGGVMLCKSTC